MAKSVLSIDLSDGQIVLARVERVGKSWTMTGNVQLSQPEKADYGQLASIAADAVEKEGLASDMVVLGLDSRDALSREFFFPFSGAAKVRQAVAFELDEVLPIRQTELCTDYLTGNKVGRGCHVVAGSVRREYLKGLLDAFDAQGISPAMVDLDAGALHRAVCDLENLPENVLIVDVGRERTLTVFQEKGRLRSFRVVRNGENRMIAQVCKAGGLTSDEAYRSLLFEGNGDAELRPEAKTVLDRFVQDILREIRLFNEFGGDWPQWIVLTGEAAKFTRLTEMLRSTTECEVRHLAADLAIFPESGLEDVSEAGSVARAYGLALPNKCGGFNFRTGDLALPGTETGNLRTVMYLAGLAAAILLSWLASFGVQLWQDGQKLQAYEDAIVQQYKLALPDVQGKFSRAQYAAIVKSRMDKFSGNDVAQPDKPNTLTILSEVHRLVGTKVNVTVKAMTLDARRLGMTGEAGTFKDVEAMRNELAKSKYFSSVKIRGATADKKTKSVRFELELVRK